MGLLTDDQSTALGLLGAGLMSGNPASGFQHGLLFLDQAKDAAIKRQMGLLQLERAQREMANERQMAEAARSSYVSPEMANGLSMGPMPDGSNVPEVRPGINLQAFADKAFQIDPMKGFGLQQALIKDETPIKLGQGEALFDRRTLKPLANNPKVDELPALVREYQFARSQGYAGTFDQWSKEQKKAGANSVSLSVSTEKNLLSDVAGGLGKSMVDARQNAQAALGTINTVNRLNEALNSGQVIAGPGTTFRQFGLQVGNMLGISGKDGQEKLLNTRQAIQSLAQLELDAAQQMKGQGQITEAERAIIRRAASGDIDSMTAGELRLLGGLLDRTARNKIRGYNTQVQPLKANPNAAAIAPFLEVPEPSAPTAGGWSIRPLGQ